jgi:hypothetical protein
MRLYLFHPQCKHGWVLTIKDVKKWKLTWRLRNFKLEKLHEIERAIHKMLPFV